MRETPEHEDLLDERTQNILMAVVQSFIQTADPVGSRTISRRFGFGLSPATIRNVMSDLEDLGFLEQPHTSAGRIPTDKGYRLYVNYLQTLDMPSLEEAELISKRYRMYQGDTDEVISTTSQLLSEVSRYAGIVLCTFSTAIFKQIEFIKIRGKQVLAIFVMQSAIVHNKVITLDEELSQDELRTISNYLNQEFSGQPLTTIRQRVLERMNEEKAEYDILSQQAINIGAKTFENSALTEADIYLGGTSNILDQPEFMTNVDHMKELFKAFEEKSRLIRILDRCIAEVGINVIIGSETSLGDIHDCSFVTHTYSYDDQTMGVLGVVGPKRMAYPRIMALVDYTADVVSRTLTRGQGLD
jgi:heat-inducible transcriptional repressor